MKSFRTLFTVGLFLLACPWSQSQAARLDFSTLEGSYKATYRYTLDGQELNGTAVDVEIGVPRNGRKAKVAISGYARISQGSLVADYVILGDFTLGADRKIIANNALLASYLQLPATGQLVGPRRNLTFSLAHSSEGVGDLVMNYTLTFRGKRLLISGQGTLNGSPVSVQLDARKNGRDPKK